MEFYKMNHEVTEKDIKKFNMENQRIGVIVHIEDKDGNILLQQRGLKSRDENGLFEDVGGSLEEFDSNYRAAIIREMHEEMGKEAKIELSDTSNIFHVSKNNTNWIFVIFKGRYLGGAIKIIEPEKCMGYKFFSYNEILNSSLVTESCKYLCKEIRNNKI